MAQGNAGIEQALANLVAQLRRYRPVAVYLFGSHVAGTPRADSDFDLAILLPPGAPAISGPERLDLVGELEALADRQVDLVVLNRAPLPLQFEVIHAGRMLYESDPEARTDWEDLVVRDYLDLQPWYAKSYRELLAEGKEGDGACSTDN